MAKYLTSGWILMLALASPAPARDGFLGIKGAGEWVI